jgi:thiamine monophosphate synthase
MSFELLAITPPAGSIDLDVIAAWRDAGALDRRMAVLLREQCTDFEMLLSNTGRLARLRALCGDADNPMLLGCTPLDAIRWADRLPSEGLAGVQLRGDPDLCALTRVRAALPDGCVGRSCHGAPQPGHGQVDYTCFAPVFSPRTGGLGKLPAGLEGLRAWTREPAAWIVALGGIGAVTARATVEAGARGLASICSFFGPPRQVAEDVAALVRALEGAPHAPPPPHRRRGRGVVSSP